jgi:DNA polymerase-3 subunit gamma/tau
VSSYQVFARKYRPQTFKEVIGQDHVTQTLANAIARNRLAHAFLFVGPRGTGKTSTARIFAKSLNCAQGPTIEPCGQCDACVEIARGNSLDVLEIDGASNNGVEQVRELRDNARFAPARDRFKIYIIDEVHMLSSAAFNALLKTLEEPPAHVKFIFATTEVHKVLPTILSRCQRFDMRRIPTPLIAAHLKQIASAESIALADSAATTIARAADGGMRDAESMLDQLAAFCGGEVTEADVMSVFGLTPMHQVATLSDALLTRDIPGALNLLNEHDSAGKDLTRLLDDLIQHLRAMLVIKVNPESESAEMDSETRATLERQGESISAARILELIEQFAAAEGRMRWAPNKRLHFEVAVVRAIQFLGQATLDEVLSAATKGSGNFGGEDSGRAPESKQAASVRPSAAAQRPAPVVHSAAPTPQQPVVPAQATTKAKPIAPPESDDSSPKQAAPESADIGDILDAGALWQKVRALTEQQRPLLASWVRAGTAIDLDSTTLRIGFATSDKAARESLARPNAIGFLRTAVEQFAGRPLDIRLEARDDLKSATFEDPTEAAAKEFDNDPLITDAVQRFEARRIDIGKT